MSTLRPIPTKRGMSDMREVISRATYKRLKGYDRQKFNDWLQAFALEIYNDACRDTAAAEITALRDEFGYGTSRVARFMAKRDSVVTAINERQFTALTVLQTMVEEEGLKIKADFNFEYMKEPK